MLEFLNKMKKVLFLCYCFFVLSVKCYFSEASVQEEGQMLHTTTDQTNGEAQLIETMIDQKLEPLHKKIFNVQDAMATKIGTIADFEDNLYKKIKDITDSIIVEQTANVIQRLSYIIKEDFIENRILELTKRIDHKLSVMQDDMQNSLVNKLEENTIPEHKPDREEEELIEQKLEIIIEKISSMNLTNTIKQDENPEVDIIENKLKSFESSRNKDIKELTDKVNLIAGNIMQINAKLELACNDKTMLDSFTVTNDKLVMLENSNLTKEHINNLETINEQILTSIIESNHEVDIIRSTSNSSEISEKIHELAKDTFVEKSKDIIKEIDNFINSKESKILETIENINKKLVKLNDIPKLEEDINKLMNISEHIQSYAEMTVNATEDTKSSSKNETEEDPFRLFCNRALQTSMYYDEKRNISKNTASVKDDLDRFMELKTGCAYGYGKMWKDFRLPEQAYDAPTIEWRFALRTPEHVRIQPSWGSFGGYYINVGFLGIKKAPEDQKTYIHERSTIRKWDFPTPDVLAIDRYVPYYLRIDRGNITVGVECASEPIFNHRVDVDSGDKVELVFVPHSRYGAKVLYDCPPDLADRLGEDY